MKIYTKKGDLGKTSIIGQKSINKHASNTGRFTQLRNNLIDRSIGHHLSVIFHQKNDDERTLPTPLPTKANLARSSVNSRGI